MSRNGRDSTSEHADHAARTFAEDLLPLPGAARHARDLVTEACVRWEVEDLTAPAVLIISELVSNVLDHAHTIMTLHLALRPEGLYLGVRDGNASPPVAAPVPVTSMTGRGLRLVEAVSTTWGYSTAAGGKTVWATLALPRRPVP
ncbi:ATP-binding protein [Actinoplanes sp. NPDC023801]|uniref:ATP-binding protein n=1 Tax=Actinoplanes sp. NPDC023801 TaxID=3154595 RepID=UPI0033DED0B1